MFHHKFYEMIKIVCAALLKVTYWLTKAMTCGWAIREATLIRGNMRRWTPKNWNTGTFRKSTWSFFIRITSTNVDECRYDELGRYDLPASVDYILETTGQKKLSYVGYSLGCTLFFISAVENPDFNDKIEMMIGLGPTSRVTQMRNVFKFLAPLDGALRVQSFHTHR